MRSYAWILGGCFGLVGAWACGDGGGGQADCLVGSRSCMCTGGGGCDPDLSCIDGICVLLGETEVGSNTNPSSDSEDETMTGSMSASATQTTATTAETGDTTATSNVTTATDDGPLLDVGNDTPLSGCTKMDMLFVLDSSASMGPERTALSATNAFGQIIDIIEMINGGGVDYRIGVSDDKDGGFESFAGDPWFDSTELDAAGMALAFNAAVGSISGQPAVGCEHVLTSGVNLLLTDQTGFVRDDALLVLVLLTDVDDYGDYDQLGGSGCPQFGCATAPVYTPEEAEDTLSTIVKAGQEGAVAAIVIAGDPSIPAMAAPCDQPGICNCDAFGCDAYWGTKLYAFADLLGTNGYTANVCNADVPAIVETALTDSIDLACMNFEPEG